MTVKLVVFALSLILFCVFFYLITSLWFRGKRNEKLKVFSLLGLLYSFWVLTNGINVLLTDELYAIVFPILPQTLVSIVPAVLLIYILHFVESRLANNPWILRVLLFSIAVDLLMLWTNPLHKEFITGYDGRNVLTGRLFLIHALISYIPVLLAVFVLFRYIIRNFRQKPILGFIGGGVAIPVVLNVLFSFQILNPGFDLTPFAFILMYGTFTVYSLQVRLFDIKETAAEEIFHSMSDALIVVDRSGIVTNVNPAFLNAFPEINVVSDITPARAVAVIMRSISMTYEPHDIYERCFSDEQVKITGAEITVTRGELSTYSLSKDIIWDKGYFMGYIVTLADISIYRKMINAIAELKTEADLASKAKGLFLSNMSHEIRTPLNAIIGMISIGQGSGDIEKKDYCFSRAESASKHLLGLINDILDISKIEADKLELSYGELNFENMLANIVNLANVRIEEKKQSFIVKLSEDMPAYIEGDELRLSQVITNLLTNAIKFTPENGTVTLDVSKTEETDNDVELRVEVTDTGIGISEEQQERLFSSFSQADSSITQKFGGTGLGLAISKRIIEMMGGKIWIESELGKGAKFIFTIRAQKISIKQLEARASAVQEEKKSRYDFRAYTILIAEDIDINREIMSAILEETNITIDYANDGAIAVEMFSSKPDRYNLILMDVNMPVMNGYEATREIRAIDSEQARHIPIVAMTANVFREDIERCLASGMNDHTGKPIDANALFGLLRNYMTYYDKNRRMKNVHRLSFGVAWDDDLLTGNALVDMQHQNLFERLSDLAAACEDGSDKDRLIDTLVFLQNRTIRHFSDEEALQLEYDYPEYENHKKLHAEFKIIVDKLAKRLEESGSSSRLSHDVNRTIVRWLVNHIQLEDKKVAEHVRAVSAT